MTTALYPGTFDPIHNGHIDIARRATRIFDELIIAVYDRPLKSLLFDTAERIALLEKALESIPRIRIVSYNTLTVDFAQQVGAHVIVRGLRVFSDFELEFRVALTNKQLALDIEFICFITSQEHTFLCCSTVKEVAALGGDVSGMVPLHVAEAMQARFSQRDSAGTNSTPIVSLRD